MKKLVENIKNHLSKNPQINENNYSNINPYFGLINEKGILKDKIYIGYDYIINIDSDFNYLENNETGIITKRKR